MTEDRTTRRAAWARVHRSAARLGERHLRQLLRDDPDRFRRFSRQFDGLLVDFSRERLDDEALAALLALAAASGVESAREAMFAGERINRSEDRAVLHPALRLAGRDATPALAEARRRFLDFAERVRSGRETGASGQRCTAILHLGIGGSDLGPAMALQALARFHDGPSVTFLAGIDGARLAATLQALDPARTLVILASKSMTTEETLINARAVRDWLRGALGPEGDRQLVAVTANPPAAAAFGIDPARILAFPDGVGGRYSVWSAVGLAVALAIGRERFLEFLAGGRAMDEHFRRAPLAENWPVLLALVGVWRRNALGHASVAVIPYDRRLRRLPAYLQQLEMESNGKRVDVDGRPVGQATAPVVWGEPGTDAEHSFFQLLHQGTDIVPVDFLLAARPGDAYPAHHDALAAHALAQSAALAFGRSEAGLRRDLAAAGLAPAAVDRLAPQRSFPGDRPSTLLLYPDLDPATLGRLLALYEHKVFVQAVLWDINAFDQWGVELGKELAARILPVLTGGAGEAELDASTRGQIRHLRRLRGAAGRRQA